MKSYWYGPILPSESTFPLSCRRILTDFITSVSSHLSRKRTADTFLAFLTNSSSMIIVFLNELSSAFENTGSTMMPEQTIDHYLEMSPESSLANVLADQQQRKKLNMIADDILSSFLDQKAYNCSAVRDFLREILAGVILQSMMSSFSRPEFINGWIVYLLSEGESEIMSAIDAGVEGARNHGVTAPKNSDDPDASGSGIVDNVQSSPQTHFKTTGQQDSNGDKATEEAIMEAKRLSAMIAAQDAQDPQPTITKDHRDLGPAANSAIGTRVEKCEDPINGHSQAMSSGDTKEILDTSEPISPHSQGQSPSLPVAPSSPSHEPLTLHGASISILDDGPDSAEKTLIWSKPTSSYLIQVEPASTRYAGWMTVKTHADFESLHDTLETISRLNKIRSFAEAHPVLPPWKGHTKQALAQNLGRYLQDALQHESLAESEKMRRFLEKDSRFGTKSAGPFTKTGFSFPSQTTFENMGKGVLGALANAPKGVAGGSKAVLGGVTGVFGSAGGNNKRLSRSLTGGSDEQINGFSASNVPFHAGAEQPEGPGARQTSLDLTMDAENPSPYNTHSSVSSLKDAGFSQNVTPIGNVNNTNPANSQQNTEVTTVSKSDPLSGDLLELSSPDETEREENMELPTQACQIEATATPQPTSTPKVQEALDNAITREETQIAVELIFAVINELYTLSSAWNIRRTLLNAAKSYILRPGNPALETIRSLLQDSIIDSNTSDETIGLYLTKLRENALPTEVEMKCWPPSPSDAEKERLRENARRLLVQRGLPQALTGVMGAVASREALEKIFDCLQVETIARGFVFSILLQALRAVIL